MGMSTHITGVKPADETFKKHYKVYEACLAAGVSIPEETDDYFEGRSPDEAGVEVDIEDLDGVNKYQRYSGSGFEVDLRKLPKDIKILRFFNAW